MLKNLVPHFRVVIPLEIGTVELGCEAVKERVLRKLVEPAAIRSEAHRAEVVASLIAREAKGSTGLGRQIAIPHARTECIEKPVIVLGIARHGIDWEAQDGKDVVLFFLILVPLEQSDLYLRILTRLTTLVRLDGFVDALVGCTDEDRVLEIIHDFELQAKMNAVSATAGTKSDSVDSDAATLDDSLDSGAATTE